MSGILMDREVFTLKKGFTLIELLIVVAIIAILAAIAVPNFLEAQTRSKVSRVKADLRSVATAVESYMVDYNKPPPQSIGGTPGNPFNAIVRPEQPSYNGTGTLTQAITTPIAYMTTFLIFDPFTNQDLSIPIDEALFTYQAYQWKWPEPTPQNGSSTAIPDSTAESYNASYTGVEWRNLYGAYWLSSVGPDRTFYNTPTHTRVGHQVAVPYDPTNGTVSFGNIARSQKETEQKSFIP
jgi:prepilin-type N-terminal cleavage/methylation domain-containing protein